MTVIERGAVAGGQATSIPLDSNKFGAEWMNNGVQGGSMVRLFLLLAKLCENFRVLTLVVYLQIFKHTFQFFRRYNHDPKEVQLQISFGKGKDGFWTNCFPSTLVKHFSADIKKFGTFLKVIKWTMPLLGLVPIRLALRLFRFSKDFGDKMVYPLIALFLGTGNQTANVPSAIVERLFQDPNMKLWDYDPHTLLPNLPTMVTFDKLHDFYEDWREDLVSRGVDIRLSTEVTEIISRDSKRGVVLKAQSVARDGSPRAEPTTEIFDEMIMCVLADDALRLLGKTVTTRERFVLGGARFYDDCTVTHSDAEYFNKHYETSFSSSLCAEPQSESQKKQVVFAKGENNSVGFRPMYYTKTYASAPTKIEMSFDCSNYQHQFAVINAKSRHSSKEEHAKFCHVYQTIFLDKREQKLWTKGEIDKDKIIQEKWWHQLGHRWQHYLRVVPGMMFLNGRNHTVFAGSWTLVVSSLYHYPSMAYTA